MSLYFKWVVNMKETVRQIDASIGVTKDLISKYTYQKEKLEANEIKPTTLYLCASLGWATAVFNVGSSLSLMMLAGLGGGIVGGAIPYLVKKIRIADLDYQILINNSIINDLNKKRERKIVENAKFEKVKKLH